ncbi:GNAT family N-acetyltransferase [bacterium]|nr:GNAT family N-acetyltransferase [bacterium]
MNTATRPTADKKLTLKDGSKVSIRPILLEDLDAVYGFFKALPEEDRAYLRFDVTDREVVEERLREIQKWGRLKRLVACVDENIVGTGVLELRDSEKDFNLAELRLIVGHDFQRQGLGMLLARELYFLAAREKISELRVHILRPQEAALSIFRRLGFHAVEVLEDAATDRYGKLQDVVILACPLEGLWREMESLVEDFDIQHR